MQISQPGEQLAPSGLPGRGGEGSGGGGWRDTRDSAGGLLYFTLH